MLTKWSSKVMHNHRMLSHRLGLNNIFCELPFGEHTWTAGLQTNGWFVFFLAKI